LYPIREGKVVADINPAIRPSFKANGVVIPFPPRAASVFNEVSAAGALSRK